MKNWNIQDYDNSSGSGQQSAPGKQWDINDYTSTEAPIKKVREPEPVKETVYDKMASVGEEAAEAVGSALAGPYEMIGRMFQGSAYVGETIGGAINSVVDGDYMDSPLSLEGSNLITSFFRSMLSPQPADTADREAPAQATWRGMSDIIGEGVDTGTEFLETVGGTTKPDIEDRYIKTLSGYVGLGAAVTQNIAMYGQRILAKGVINPGIFQKIAIGVAKNPVAAQKVEAGINTLAALSGQTVEEVAPDSPWLRMGVEVGSAVSAGGLYKIGQKSVDFLVSKGVKEEIANNSVAEYLINIVKEDAGLLKTLKKNTDLAIAEGVSVTSKNNPKGLTVADRSGNTELKAAQQQLDTAFDAPSGGITREQQKQQLAQQEIKQKLNIENPDLTGLQAKVGLELQKNIKQAEDHINVLLQNATAEAERMARVAPYEAGTKGLELIKQAEDLSWKNVGDVYKNIKSKARVKGLIVSKTLKQIDRDTNLPASRIKNLEVSAELKENILSFYNIQKDTYFNLESLKNILPSLKEEMRIASSQGRSQTKRTLARITDAVMEEMDSFPVGAQYKEVLEAANKTARTHFDRFNSANIELLTRVDLQGAQRVSPEDFIKRVIKTYNGTDSVTAVKAFKHAIGNDVVSKDWLKNAYLLTLKQTRQAGEPVNPKTVKDFLHSHKESLREAGIYDELSKMPASEIATELAFARSNLKQSMVEWTKGRLAEFAGTADIESLVQSKINNGSLPYYLKKLKSTGNADVAEGVGHVAWQTLAKKAYTGAPLENGTSMITGDVLRKILETSPKNIIGAVGKDGYRRLKGLVKLMDMTQKTNVKVKHEILSMADSNIKEKLITGFRAAAHGFVRPDLIVAQAGMRTFKAMRTVESQNLLREALLNEELFKKLVLAGESRRTRNTLRGLFSAAVPITVNGVWGEE